MRELKLFSFDRLRETEEHDSGRAKQLADVILELGFQTVPIAAEHSMLAVMDGQHRFNAAKYLNLARVRWVLMDYGKSGVALQSWRSEWEVRVDDIFLMIKEGKKFLLRQRDIYSIRPLKK